MMSALSYGVRNPGFAVCVLLLSVLCVTACGDDGGDIEVTPPAPGGGVQIRGTERLSWDQTAPSFARVRQYAFNAYVDGTAAALTGVECLDSSSAAGFPCSARVPQMSNGTHTLQLAAIVDGTESAKSAPLVVTMNQGRLIISGVAPAAAVDAVRAGPSSLCIESTAECFLLRREITRSAAIASPAVLPDGRLLFVENERDIRIASDGRLAGEPAFTLPEIRARIVELLVDPAFERTRFIRIGWVRDSGPNGRTFGVTRLRESNNRFGEAAVIVPELPFRAATDPRVAQDDQGRIYVAVPSPDNAPAGSDPYSGELLRFSADGSAWTAGLGSPAFASGFDTPHALAFDAQNQRLWLGGQDRRGRQTLRAMPLGTSEPAVSAPAYRLQQQVYEIATNTRVAALATTAGDGSSTRADLVIADGDGSLFWSRTGSGGLVLERAVGLPERVLDVDATPSGALLVTTSNAASPPSFSIFRLDRRASR
jgi:hypothetical protein